MEFPPTVGSALDAVCGWNDDVDAVAAVAAAADDAAAVDAAAVVADADVAAENSRALSLEVESAGRFARPPRPTGAPPRYRDPPALRILISTGFRAMINPCRVSGRAARGPRCPPPRPWVSKRPCKQRTPRDPTWSPAKFRFLLRIVLIHNGRIVVADNLIPYVNQHYSFAHIKYFEEKVPPYESAVFGCNSMH